VFYRSLRCFIDRVGVLYIDLVFYKIINMMHFWTAVSIINLTCNHLCNTYVGYRDVSLVSTPIISISLNHVTP